MDRAKDKNKLKHISITSAIIICSSISASVYEASASPGSRFKFPKLGFSNPFKKGKSKDLVNPYGPSSSNLPTSLSFSDPGLTSHTTPKRGRLQKLWDRIKGIKKSTPPQVVPHTLSGPFLNSDERNRATGGGAETFIRNLNDSWQDIYNSSGSENGSAIVSFSPGTGITSNNGTGSGSPQTTRIRSASDPTNNTTNTRNLSGATGDNPTMPINRNMWGRTTPTPDDDDNWDTRSTGSQSSNGSSIYSSSSFNPDRPALAIGGQPILTDDTSGSTGSTTPLTSRPLPPLPADTKQQGQTGDSGARPKIKSTDNPAPLTLQEELTAAITKRNQTSSTQEQQSSSSTGGDPIYDVVTGDTKPTPPPVAPKPKLTPEQKAALGIGGDPIYDVVANDPPPTAPKPKLTPEQKVALGMGQGGGEEPIYDIVSSDPPPPSVVSNDFRLKLENLFSRQNSGNNESEA